MVVHYAGEVAYDVRGFLEKNKDTLAHDISQAMARSDDPLINTLFPPAPAVKRRGRAKTVGGQFKARPA